MRLTELKLSNFRGYRDEIAIQIDDLTAFIGRNDAGKSTILDALNIVLADGKVENNDICVHASSGDRLLIECAFDDLPDILTLDSSSTTSLTDEYLVDQQGRLRLQWSWPIKGDADELTLGKQLIHAIAWAPQGPGLGDLHEKKNPDLKRLVRDAGIEALCDLNNNASMRRALWLKALEEGRLTLAETAIDLAKEEGKTIFKQIQDNLPMFVLFRADRPSTDQDAEVQDPMKVAVREALDDLHDEIAAIKDRVREKSIAVANRTLAKLRDFDPSLARSLTPLFADPKLDTAFKLTLLGDDGIPVNKRGSGIRRLVLFSFFQAEAERRQGILCNRSMIYAVEEPETAQHPNFQRVVVNSLRTLSEQDRCQVLLTTHVPGLAGLLPVESLRLVEREDTANTLVSAGTDAVYGCIIKTLGVVPDHRARVLLCVEGPTDLACLRSLCKTYRYKHKNLVCIETDPRIASVLLGGGTLENWTAEHLLRNTGLREFHIYDRDVPKPDGSFKYSAAVETVEQRGNGDTARLTRRREIENYLHPAAIDRTLAPVVGHAVQVEFTQGDDVEAIVAAAIPDHQGNPRKKLKRRELKSWLNREVASAMTLDELTEVDQDEELLDWFRAISALACS